MSEELKGGHDGSYPRLRPLMSHDAALDVICGSVGTVQLSYQEAIEGYLDLRGIKLSALRTPDAARDAVLEEAASVADRFAENDDGSAFDTGYAVAARSIAACIRAKKSPQAIIRALKGPKP